MLKTLNYWNLYASVAIKSVTESVIKDLNKRFENLQVTKENSTLKKYVHLPEKNEKNLLNIGLKIGEFIECAIFPIEVDTIFLAHSSPSDKPKPVIVKLLARHKRDAI